MDAECGRGRLLRTEARIRAPRRDPPRLAMRHDSGRPEFPGPSRRLLHRALGRESGAGDAAPGDVRLVGALHRYSRRALCRALAVVAHGPARVGSARLTPLAHLTPPL